MLYRAFRLASALAQAAPLRLAYAVAALCGVAAYYAWPGGRRRCIANMRHLVRDEAAARRAARRSFANYATYLVDFLRFPRTTVDEIERRFVFAQWDDIHAARSGNGIVFVTMHFGNWDVGAAALAQRVPVFAVADPFADPRLTASVFEARRHLGMQLLPATRVGPSVVRALRSNAVVATLIDVPPGDAGVHVEFFGGTVAVHDGPARLALRTGASVLAAVCPREHPRSTRIHGQVLPVPFTATGDTEHDVHAFTQAIMRTFEAMIAPHPEQWYIFRSLWLSDRAAQTIPFDRRRPEQTVNQNQQD